MTERFPTDNELQCAWDDYLDAADRAKCTRDFQDGILAGKLWGRFIRMFERGSIKGHEDNVIYIERFGRRSSSKRGIA